MNLIQLKVDKREKEYTHPPRRTMNLIRIKVERRGKDPEMSIGQDIRVILSSPLCRTSKSERQAGQETLSYPVFSYDIFL
jgi:hypothetical protein